MSALTKDDVKVVRAQAPGGLRRCDVCDEPRPHLYDTPCTVGGRTTWGNLCDGCTDLYGHVTTVTTKVVYEP